MWSFWTWFKKKVKILWKQISKYKSRWRTLDNLFLSTKFFRKQDLKSCFRTWKDTWGLLLFKSNSFGNQTYRNESAAFLILFSKIVCRIKRPERLEMFSQFIFLLPPPLQKKTNEKLVGFPNNFWLVNFHPIFSSSSWYKSSIFVAQFCFLRLVKVAPRG